MSNNIQSKVLNISEEQLKLLEWSDTDSVQTLVDVEASNLVVINHSKAQREVEELKRLRSKSDFVNDVKTFNEIAGTLEEFDPRKIALYTGLVLEEVAEMLDSLDFHVDVNVLAAQIESMATRFKKSEFDYLTNSMNREEYLDAAVDIAVVALGAGISVGSDIEGACREVTSANLAKFPIVDGQYTVLRDENGKVQKPEGWKAPNTGKYLR